MDSWRTTVAHQPHRTPQNQTQWPRPAAQSQPQWYHRFRPSPPPPQRMSTWSSAQVPDSSWCDENFLLGAGMVVFQPETHKVVVLYESKKKYWFLPKGRKDVGESLEQTALREAYEESGYRVEFLPLFTQTSAPGPPSDRGAPFRMNCEPIKIATHSYPERRRRNYTLPAGEYLSFWYVGQIPGDAVREEGTGMADEVNYVTHLLTVREALSKLGSDEAEVVNYAYALYIHTVKRLLEEEERHQTESGGTTVAGDTSAAVTPPTSETSANANSARSTRTSTPHPKPA